MVAKDSLVNIRAAYKRSVSERKAVKSSSPLQQLRDQVERKRRRVEKKPLVTFDMEHVEIHTYSSTEDDVRSSWLSRNEMKQIKHDMIRVVSSVRNGTFDPESDSKRGLEQHAHPLMLKEKMDKAKTFVDSILHQQEFLRTLMGNANDQILGRLSAQLSEQDTKVAQQYAILDAKAASSLLESSAFERTPIPFLPSEPCVRCALAV